LKNQLDLWSGGHQLNRATKYLNSEYNTDASKVLCVICNHIILLKDTNKKYNLFKFGFEKNRLCYINNINNIIKSYFH
jgi:hypothetical protein